MIEYDDIKKANKRIKELIRVADKLFDLVHEGDIIQHKIIANDLYDIIIKDKTNE